MVFWQFWEIGFQAFMIFIGVGIIWMRFIEILFPDRGVSVILMIIAAVGLATVRIILGARVVRKQQQALKEQIAGLSGPGQEAK